jgi:hypothetical protein
MLRRWLLRRQEARRLAQADAEALIRDDGADEVGSAAGPVPSGRSAGRDLPESCASSFVVADALAFALRYFGDLCRFFFRALRVSRRQSGEASFQVREPRMPSFN